MEFYACPRMDRRGDSHIEAVSDEIRCGAMAEDSQHRFIAREVDTTTLCPSPEVTWTAIASW
jgi:hypothetical protein